MCIRDSPQRLRHPGRGRHRPRRRAGPGGPGRPLHDGRGRGRSRGALLPARPLRRRRVLLHGSARRQPARLQLAQRVLRLRQPRRPGGARRDPGREPATAARVALRPAHRGDPGRRLGPGRAAAPPRPAARAARRPLPAGGGDRDRRAGAGRDARRPPPYRLPGPRPRTRRRPHRDRGRRRGPPRGAEVVLLGVDGGGTFTDAVLFDGETVHTAKLPSTPEDQSVGVIEAVEEVLGGAAAGAGAVESFAHGMTVGTNALLEQRGARTALIATRGFADLLEIGRQERPELYRLCAPKPAPLVEPELRFEAAERTGPEGEIEPLAEGEPQRLAELVRESGAESVAVCLLFYYLDPAHEREIAARLRDQLPDVHVSASHEVLPRFREHERCSTTTIDAYLSPLLGRYLGRLGESAAAAGLPQPLVMQSSGGVAAAGEATPPEDCITSG